MKRTVQLATACMAALLLTGTARAHDFWLEPDKFHVARGEPVALLLRHGGEYEGEAARRDNFFSEKFVWVGPDGTEPVPVQDRQELAGRMTLAKDGIYLVPYRGKRLPL